MICTCLILAYTNRNRKSPLFNHLSTISEGIPALGWILVSPTPVPHIKEMSDAAQFYANRVLKEFKEKDPTHVEWVKQWMKVLSELHAYVKQYHTTGLTWGSHRQHNINVPGASALVGSASALAPPPPPPPPPPPAAAPPLGLSSKDNAAESQSRDQLMSTINALGTSATSHLKKVSDELKLHKNPQLRDESIQPGKQHSTASNTVEVSETTLI
jgi:adenylyl cyclase-associated protein